MRTLHLAPNTSRITSWTKRLAAGVTPVLALVLIAAAPPERTDARQTIIEVLQEQGDFTVLLNALEQTGLNELLAGEDAYTLLAPTDDAFAALPEGTLGAMSTDELAALLQNHVIAGTVGLADAGETVTTLGGAELPVIADAVGVMIGGATVLMADMEAANGVVHRIDSVLLQPGAEG